MLIPALSTARPSSAPAAVGSTPAAAAAARLPDVPKTAPDVRWPAASLLDPSQDAGFEVALSDLEPSEIRQLLSQDGVSYTADDEGDLTPLAVELRARHAERVAAWLAERPGKHAQPPTPSLATSLCRVGTPVAHRWTLWQRALGIHVMPRLKQQAPQLRALLSTALPNQAELEADAQAALLGALGERVSALPDGALALLCQEFAFHLLVLLKKARLPYSADLAIAPLLAPVLLLAVLHAGDPADGALGRMQLALHRAETLNAMSAVLAKLTPAVIAGAPWGLGPTGAPATAPNETLLSHVMLFLQWESPALAEHLHAAPGILKALSRLMLGLLAPAAAPAAVVRFIELALWESPTVPKGQPVLLLCALLLREETRLLGVPASSLAGTLSAQLSVPSVVEADRLHAAAAVLNTTLPVTLRAALDATWCAARPPAACFACTWLEPPEVLSSGVWVIDLRSHRDFEAAHFALTSHLPPAEARGADAREAVRQELFDICAEGGFTLAFVTANDPNDASGSKSVVGAVKKGSAQGSAAPDAERLTSEEVRLLVLEMRNDCH